MANFFQIEIVHEGVRRGQQHIVNRVVREALQAMGLEWRAVYLPDHFTKKGARKYGYMPRSGEPGSNRGWSRSYTKHKLAIQKHTLPLVWSGEGRGEALYSKQAIAKATSKRAHVTLPLPRVFNWKNPKSNVNMRKEIETVTTDEVRSLERFLVEEIERRWQRLNETMQFTVRIAA